MCYEENATGHYCTLTGQGELAIAAGEGHCVPYSALFGSEPFFVEKGSDSIRFSMPDRDSSTHGVDLPCRPRSTPTNSQTTMRRYLSKAGWVRWRGCPRHGCRGQAPKVK
ncbi:hypothetical protein FEO87_05025 [Stenotrophomonas maltophilia]|nr:hypothetical protein FEO87_05025 [Stenotrophomonas maltophilia]